MSAGCKGVDRTMVCFNCGKSDYWHTQCEDRIACCLWSKEGHRAVNCRDS